MKPLSAMIPAGNVALGEAGGCGGGLEALAREAFFMWGRGAGRVRMGFARHVRDRLPAARHCELDCGHVPQLERPRQTHDAVTRFLSR